MKKEIIYILLIIGAILILSQLFWLSMPFVNRTESWGITNTFGFNLVRMTERTEPLGVAFRFLLVPMLIASIGKVLLTQKYQDSFKKQLNILNLFIALASLGYGFAVYQSVRFVKILWGSSPTATISMAHGSIIAIITAITVGVLYLFIFIYSCIEKKKKSEVSED